MTKYFILFIWFIGTSVLKLSVTAQKFDETDPASNFLAKEKDLRDWEPPEEFHKNYTYTWSGMDDEGRPVWIAELGKWNARKIVEGGKESMEKFDKYVDKLVINIGRSLSWNMTTDNSSYPQIVLILDVEGFDYYQFTSVPTVQYVIKKFAYLAPILTKYVHHGYVLNTNYVAELMINLLKPVLGPAMARAEILGTSRSKWTQRLLSTLPRDQLPEWYGGIKDFLPIKVFG